MPLYPPRSTQEQLKQAWVRQLYKEFAQICFQYRIKLSQSILDVRNLSSRYGDYNPKDNKITISTNLIENHSWLVVLEVLKHEMAHQIVYEIFHSNDNHGHDFKRACSLLGMEDWSMQASISLPSGVEGQKKPKGERERNLLRRVNKLLSLAQSSNPHEAYLAMARVKTIFEDYNLQMIAHDNSHEYSRIIINHKKKKIKSFESQIAGILSKHFQVRILYSSLYDSEKNCEHKIIEIFGNSQNLGFAEYVYWFLWNNMKIYWQEYKQSHLNVSQYDQMSYFSGVLSAFEEKIAKISGDHRESRERDRAIIVESEKLIAQEDRQLGKYIEYRHPRLRKSYSYQSQKKVDAYMAGRKKGKTIVIYKGLYQNDNRKHQKRITE